MTWAFGSIGPFKKKKKKKKKMIGQTIMTSRKERVLDCSLWD